MSAFRSGILPLDIGFDLLDRSAESLQDVRGEGVFAGLGLALVALCGGSRTRRLGERARWGRARLRVVEEPDVDLELQAELREDRLELVDVLLFAEALAGPSTLRIRGKAELELARRPLHDAGELAVATQRQLALGLEVIDQPL